MVFCLWYCQLGFQSVVLCWGVTDSQTYRSMLFLYRDFQRLSYPGHRMGMLIISCCTVAQSSQTFYDPMEPARLFCPCGSSRQEYWSGLLCPLLAIFRTHVSRTAGGFFTTWATRESPRMLEWAACPFSKGSSWPRNWTRSPAFQADSLPPEPPGKPH